MKYDLTGIYWIKNEAPYLSEYLEFHLLQGFEHFIFYDNDSTDKTEEILKPYIEEGLVELRKYPLNINIAKNFWVMAHSIAEQRQISKWIHFHAIDERIFCPNGIKITEFLKNYEQFSGVCVAWKMFNSNGLLKKPRGLIIENYHETVHDEQYHIKTIIQPEKTIPHPPPNPHEFYYINNIAVDENFKHVVGPFHKNSAYTMQKIKNHHYVTLSKQEFEEKMNKGLLDHRHTENVRRNTAEAQWHYMHNPPDKNYLSNDKTLFSYTEIVKENIKKRYKYNQEILDYLNL